MVNVGIVGSGFGLYGLLPAFNATVGCKVISICSSKTQRLLEYYQNIGLKKIYSDWQVMLANEKLDAIALAVPPNMQYQIAKVAIGRGLHIFAEKPLAVTYKQAKELLDLAEKNKIKHSVDFLFPEIEEWKKVKDLIDKKVLGKLKQICLNWDFLSYDIENRRSSWKTDSALGGGALSLYFSHSLYYLEHYAGLISGLKSLLTYSKESMNGGEVGVDLLLKFKDNITGYAHLCCNARGLNRHQLIFICENGTIVLENEGSYTSNFNIKIYTDGKIRKVSVPKEKSIKKNSHSVSVLPSPKWLQRPTKASRGKEDERVKVVKKIASRFVDSIIYNKKVTPSFKEGARVQWLIEKIRENSLQ